MDGTQPHLTPQPNPLTHADVAGMLPEYVAELLAGRSPETRFPLVAAHLAGCKSCQVDLDELLALTAETYGDESPLPTKYPEFTLPPAMRWALVPEGPPMARWRRGKLGEWLLTLTRELLALGQGPLLVGMARADDLLYDLRVAPEGDAPELRVEVFSAAAGAEVYLRLSVDAPELDVLDMAEFEVTATAGGQTWRARTNDLGVASLRGIPRAALDGLELGVTAGQ